MPGLDVDGASLGAERRMDAAVGVAELPLVSGEGAVAGLNGGMLSAYFVHLSWPSVLLVQDSMKPLPTPLEP